MIFKKLPKSSRHFMLSLLLVMPLLSSCALQRHNVVGGPLDQSFAEALVSELVDQSAQVDSVQGLAKFKMISSEHSLSGSQVLLAEKPDRLRAETLSPFGSPLLLLSADGENLRVLLPSQNRYYKGLATPENLGRFVRIPLKLNDLVSVLLYQPPLFGALIQEAFDLEKGGWLLVRHRASLRQELVFNVERQLVEVSYFEKEKLFLRVNYGKFAGTGARFPHLLEINLPDKETTIHLEFSDVEANGKLRPGIFLLEPPAGVDVVPLDQV